MSFESQLWDSFGSVAKKAKSSITFGENISKILAERSTVSAKAAKALLKVAQDKSLSSEVEVGQLNVAFEAAKEAMVTTASAHQEHADGLATLSKSVADSVKDRKRRVKAAIASGEKLDADLVEKDKKMRKAKEKYDKAKQAEQKSRAEADAAQANPQLLAKATKKVEKDAKSAEKADAEYAEAVRILADTQDTYYGSAMPAILRELEALEAEHAAAMATALAEMATRLGALAPPISSVASSSGSAAKAVEPGQHCATFAQATMTGETVRPKAEYVPFGQSPASSGVPVSTSGGGGYGGGGGGTPIGGGGGQSFSPRGGGGVAAAAPAAVSAPVAAAALPASAGGGADVVHALYDYDAQDEGELSFRTGEPITVLSRDDSGWWQCQTEAGEVGIAPMNFLQEGAGGASGGATAASGGGGGEEGQPPAEIAAPGQRVRALYDYDADGSDELSMKAGDVFTVNSEEAGWYNVTAADGSSGTVPSNFTAIE